MPPLRPQALLDDLRNVVALSTFDAEHTLGLLAMLQASDVQLQGAIRHASHCAASAMYGGARRIAVARFAVARVVVLLEQLDGAA